MDSTPFVPVKSAASILEAASDDCSRKFSPDARQRIVDNLMEIFKNMPVAIPERMIELQKLAVELEEKIYCAAISKHEYLLKISSKMIILEANIHPAAPINPRADNQQSSATDAMLPQVDNQVQLLPSNPVKEKALPQNIPYNTSSMENSGGILSFKEMPSCAYLNGLCKTRVEQGSFPSLQQQTQNRECDKAHVHPQLVKQKRPNSVMQPSKQQQSSCQHVQSVVIPPKAQPSTNQQTSSSQQQSDATYEKSNLQMQQIQQLMGKQVSVPNVSCVQPHLPEQKESVLDAQQQQQQRVPIKHKILLGQQQPQRLQGQKKLYLHPQQQFVLKNSMQDQLKRQQMHKLPTSLLNASNVPPDQQLIRLLEQSKSIAPSEEALLESSMKYFQQQQQQLNQSLQLRGSETPFQLGQLQQSSTLQENPDCKKKHMQQSLQYSDSMLRVQSSIGKPKKFIQSHQRGSEAPPTLMEATDQTGNIGVNWQELYQKVQSVDACLPELQQFHQMITRELQQLDATMQTAKYAFLNMIKKTLDRQIDFFHKSKNNISVAPRDKLPEYEKSMFQMAASHREPSQQLVQEQSQQPCGHAHAIPQKLPSQTLLMQQHGNHGKEMRKFPSSINSKQSGSAVTLGSFSSPQQNSISDMQKYCLGHFQNSHLNTQHTHFRNLPDGSKEALLPSFRSLEDFNVQQQQHMKQEMWKDLLQNQQNECQLQNAQIQQNLLHPQQMQQLQAAKLPVYAEPKISLHSSSQVDRLALLSSHRIPTTPMQCKSSPSALLPPSTPVAKSTVPGNSEKHVALVKLPPDTGVTELQTAKAPTKAQSLAFAVPGTSGSPLLAQFTGLDDKICNLQATIQRLADGQRLKQFVESGNHPLLDEIREVSQSLCDTVVSMSDEDSDNSDTTASASAGVKGTIVKCSYSGVSLSPGLRAHFASLNMSPIEPLKLLIPANYPESSPLVLDNLQDQTRTHGEEVEDLTVEAKSRFCRSLKDVSRLMSLGEMVRLWDSCTREVIVEYARQRGGGTFSSTYCNWQKCVDF
ncbi:hypothetical protein HPP92_010547 [Vanilla planifolia]|uniref:Mediator complex subunit 15 KIX domain-containing protein n=1 Tax=Vanilla planifolia TaxID=51239 RepID=A0A835QVW8_VANPL|nr:hypothetical protein HPP92_010547 [Vanilla planifolia]